MTILAALIGSLNVTFECGVKRSHDDGDNDGHGPAHVADLVKYAGHCIENDALKIQWSFLSIILI